MSNLNFHGPLFDHAREVEQMEAAAAARKAKDEGQRAAWASVPSDWRTLALEAVAAVARAQARLTIDDVRPRLPYDPPNPNTMGSLLPRAARQGLIEFSGEYAMSERPERHAAPVKVWRSLVYRVA